MATWRQVLEVVMTDEDVARLTALSRSRTEPANRAACVDASVAKLPRDVGVEGWRYDVT
jgi:hypothetical protein